MGIPSLCRSIVWYLYYEIKPLILESLLWYPYSGITKIVKLLRNQCFGMPHVVSSYRPASGLHIGWRNRFLGSLKILKYYLCGLWSNEIANPLYRMKAVVSLL